MKTQLKADLMLVIVTLGWGMSYYFIDICLKEMGTFTLNAFRFLGAFLAAGVLAFSRLKHVNIVTLKYSLYIGIALVIVYIGATFGVKYTSLSNAGFLCALAVVFTPVLAFFCKEAKTRQKADGRNSAVHYRYCAYDAGRPFQNGIRRYIVSYVRFCILHRSAHHRSGSFQSRCQCIPARGLPAGFYWRFHAGAFVYIRRTFSAVLTSGVERCDISCCFLYRRSVHRTGSRAAIHHSSSRWRHIHT